MEKFEFKDSIKEALATHEALRRIGFKPEEIFVAVNLGTIYVVLKSQGKEFVVGCGPYEGKSLSFKKEWETAINLWNNELTDEQILKIYKSSSVFKNTTKFCNTLFVEREFKLPNLSDKK